MTDAVLWTGGRVFTGRRYVGALLTEGGRVIAAGAEGPVRAQAPTGVDRRSLRGHLIVPGLIDAHLHLSEVARRRSGLDLSTAPSREAALAAVAAWAADHPRGPVVGRGFDPERWGDRRWPTATDLDRVVGDRPTMVFHASGHALVANSVALREVSAGATGRTEPAPGRSADARPSGAVYEDAMRPLSAMASAAEPVGPEALHSVLRELSSLGVTGVGGMNASPEEVEALRALGGSGRLPVWTRTYLRLADLSRVRVDRPAEDDRWGIVGVKAFLDGAFGPRTAWLSAPYSDAPERDGLEVGEDGELAEALARAGELGLAPALHAIGDRAVGRACRLLDALPRHGAAPPRIEHGALTPPAVLAALDRIRPTVVVQPGFVWSDAWLTDRVGPGRARWAYAFRTLRSRGIPLAASSDAPYDPVDPWRGLAATVARCDPAGRSANPEGSESLAPEEALALYTGGAADALGLPLRGRLEPGDRADLLVLSAPDLRSAVRGGRSSVAETWSDARRVFAGPGALGE